MSSTISSFRAPKFRIMVAPDHLQYLDTHWQNKDEVADVKPNRSMNGSRRFKIFFIRRMGMSDKDYELIKARAVELLTS